MIKRHAFKERKEDNPKMAKQRMVAAVDVGSSKICSLLANVDAEDSIHSIGVTPSAGIHKGLVADIDQASEASATPTICKKSRADQRRKHNLCLSGNQRKQY